MNHSPPLFPPEALWIGSDHPFDLHEAYLCFRAPENWTLAQQPNRAELFVSADSRYKLWINGQFVARGPGRCYPHAQCIDRLDVTPFLRRGANTIALQVYQPGYSHFAYVHRGAAGVLAHLTCDRYTVLVTDERWRVRRDPSFAAQVARVSIYSSGVEERDLNLVDAWLDPTYDDSAWAGARVVAPVGGYPWTSMQRRDLPPLIEEDVPLALLETRRGRYLVEKQFDAHLALTAGWRSAMPHPLPKDESGWYSPNIAAGESAYWLFDLARDHTCQG